MLFETPFWRPFQRSHASVSPCDFSLRSPTLTSSTPANAPLYIFPPPRHASIASALPSCSSRHAPWPSNKILTPALVCACLFVAPRYLYLPFQSVYHRLSPWMATTSYLRSYRETTRLGIDIPCRPRNGNGSLAHTLTIFKPLLAYSELMTGRCTQVGIRLLPQGAWNGPYAYKAVLFWGPCWSILPS